MITVRDVTKRYQSGQESVLAMDNLSIDIASGSFVTLLGPSGCGKTTLLRCIAGLETPDTGEIVIDHHIVFSLRGKIDIPSNRRQIGMVFQSYAIWPHMTVFQNVAFPLEVRRATRIRERVRDVLSLVGLADFADRYASRLSGGQQQRVALARAIVAKPAVLLLDEPLSNLDAELRQQMCKELRNLQEELGITTVYVTHDQSEALTLSDYIAVIRNGNFVEWGQPRDLYYRPQNTFTAQFIGGANMINGEPISQRSIRTPFGLIESTSSAGADKVTVFIRPENVRLLGTDGGERPDTNVFMGRAVSCRFAGSRSELEVVLESVQGETTLRCTAPGAVSVDRDQPVRIHVRPDDVYLIAEA